LGDNYVFARDHLREEFETKGPGQLVHPYWGEFKVNVTSRVRIKETPDEGGMARFDLDMVEVEETQITFVELSLVPEVDAAAVVANAAASADYEESFSLVGAIEAVRSAAVSALQSITSTISSVRAPINALVNLVDDVGSAIDDLEDSINLLIDTPAALISALQDINALVFDGLAAVDSVTANLIAAGQKLLEAVDGSSLFDDFRATRALEAFADLTTNGDDFDAVQDTGSTQSDIEAANQAAIVKVAQVSSAIAAAKAFAVFEFDNRDKAIEVRDTVANKLAELAETASDQSYAALMDLRAALSRHLAKVTADLPEIVEITPQETISSLQLAYDIYGDLRLEQDIITRNRVENPIQVPGSVVLKVVSSG